MNLQGGAVDWEIVCMVSFSGSSNGRRLSCMGLYTNSVVWAKFGMLDQWHVQKPRSITPTVHAKEDLSTTFMNKANDAPLSGVEYHTTEFEASMVLRRGAWPGSLGWHDTTKHDLADPTQHNKTPHNPTLGFLITSLGVRSVESITPSNLTWHSMTRHDTTRHDTTQHDTTRHHMIQHGKTMCTLFFAT